MRAGRFIGFAFAIIFLGLGLLFLLATGSPTNGARHADGILAAVLLALGIGTLVLTLKFLPAIKIEETVVQKIDLTGQTELEQMKCKSCGGTLDASALKVAGDGSVVVNCPFCGSTYQITEKPKW
jgi:Zn finger protein HypA/HybF involved in hydrogenase expression